MPSKAALGPEFEVLPLKLAYEFLESCGLGTEAEAIRTSHEQIGKHSTSTSRRAKILTLLRSKSLFDQFVKTCWPHALTPDGKKRIERYDKVYAEYKSGVSVTTPPLEGYDTEAGTEFALEENLRDYLAKNLVILEQGMKLWPLENEEDAVEFQVDDAAHSRRIDILARDQQGLPVVIELKVSSGHEKTIGQALYYRAKIKEKFAASKVRIFIVAAEISPELRAAASEIADTILFEYALSMKVSVVAMS